MSAESRTCFSRGSTRRTPPRRHCDRHDVPQHLRGRVLLRRAGVRISIAASSSSLADSPRSKRARPGLGTTAFVLGPAWAALSQGENAIVPIRVRTLRIVVSDSPKTTRPALVAHPHARGRKEARGGGCGDHVGADAVSGLLRMDGRAGREHRRARSPARAATPPPFQAVRQGRQSARRSSFRRQSGCCPARLWRSTRPSLRRRSWCRRRRPSRSRSRSSSRG